MGDRKELADRIAGAWHIQITTRREGERAYDQYELGPDEHGLIIAALRSAPAQVTEDCRTAGREIVSDHTPGPWEYVPSNENHGPYVVGPHGGDICDCYTMSNPNALSVRNGGDSKPIHFFHEMADPNARLIAAAPDLLAELTNLVECLELAQRNDDLPLPFAGYGALHIEKARGCIIMAGGSLNARKSQESER